MGRLTDKAVKNAAAGRHGDGDLLHLVVSASDRRKWILRYQERPPYISKANARSEPPPLVVDRMKSPEPMRIRNLSNRSSRRRTARQIARSCERTRRWLAAPHSLGMAGNPTGIIAGKAASQQCFGEGRV